MNAFEENIMNMMTADSDEYDIYAIIESASSNEKRKIVAKILYFGLNDVELCNFFNKSNEVLQKGNWGEDKIIKFRRTFNDIKYEMNEILRSRLPIQDDTFTVSIEDSYFGKIYTYIIDLDEMTISHSSDEGQFVLAYEADTRGIEYLLDENLRLSVGSKPNYIHVSRVITPIQTFVLSKY